MVLSTVIVWRRLESTFIAEETGVELSGLFWLTGLLLLGLLGLAVLYQLLPFREAGASKPWLAPFPKYRMRLTRFLAPAEVERRLGEMGFTRRRSNGNTMRFERGSVFGDLSLKWVKLRIELKRMGNETEVTLAASYMIIFDTGDLWMLSRDVLGALHAHMKQ